MEEPTLADQLRPPTLVSRHAAPLLPPGSFPAPSSTSFDVTRPWLGLLKTDFRQLALVSDPAPAAAPASAAAPADAASDKPATPAAAPSSHILHLPTEVTRNIFARLDAEWLSAAAQTCVQWRAVAYEPALWRRLAMSAWPSDPPRALERRLWSPPSSAQQQRQQRQQHGYRTWRRMVVLRPRLRTAGLYVQRHQYAKSRARMVTDGDVAPVFLVTYYRYMRFYTDGSVVALTSPEPPERVFRRVRHGWKPGQTELRKSHPSVGKYVLAEHSRTVTITLPTAQDKLYPNMLNGVQHLSMSLSSTHEGANNRLYVLDHFAIMDNGDVVPYQNVYNGKSWRFVLLRGFRSRIYEHFPKEATAEGKLLNWAPTASES